MGLWQLFRDSKKLRAANPIGSISIIDSPTGNHYGLQTDQTYYVLLSYTGGVIDERINKDIAFFVNHYFAQGYVCVSLWFKGESVPRYSEGLPPHTCVEVPTHKYLCYFNHAVMQTARTADNTSIYYPKAMQGCYCFEAVGPNGAISTYQVFRDKAKRLSEPPEYSYSPVQFLGYVARAKHKRNNISISWPEFVYNYTMTSSSGGN